MNQVAWQIFGGSKLKANTFIGGVASTITTSGALATKLEIASNRITNFKIVGSDIECRISGSYVIPDSAFIRDTSITYYYDYENCTLINYRAFRDCTNLSEVVFDNVTYIDSQAFYKSVNLKKAILKSVITIGSQAFDGDGIISKLSTLYAPNCTILGGTIGFDFVFRNQLNVIFYCHPSLATNNAGAPDGDITNTAFSNKVIPRYVTNYTPPSSITNLSVGNVYGTAVQLNFTAPSSTNAIDYYELWQNGVYIKNVVSGEYIIGLTANTSYIFEIKSVDIFYNKSTFSNSLSVTTTISYTDTDANAYISAATLIGAEQESAYQLITDLKTAGLWTKIQALYPFKGTTAAQHKWNAKNPLDTNAAFRLTFNGTGTYSNLGFQTNGSNSYANTYFAPSANQNVNSNGITAVVGTNNTVNNDNATLGSYNSESQMTVFTSKGDNTTFYRQSLINNRGSAIIQTGVNEARGIWTAMRTAATAGKMFRNNSLIGTGVGGGSLPNLNIYIGTLNYIGSAGGFSTQRIQIVAFHEGLSDAEVATLHSIIDLSEVIAGRKTW
jgi:hypothetical protein